MFAFRTPPVLYLLLFLLSANCSFAVIRYVNVNNPTPGAGTSWATAYNDLNQALAASTFPAHYGDEIWVAQGTYKPTTTNNRAATFLATFGYSVYGGFAGTETARTQRNPKLYLTILSGDIGVAGNASDNSYHVVTLQGFQGGRDFDGFTISDGNANAGYPGSTTPQPDNSGGGVLELALAGDASYADLKNDIIINNFAVYGGGFCSYGDGASAQSFFNLNTLLFDNNTAVFGGAVGAVTMNGDWGMPYMQNCIFTNNNSLTGQGSVLACLTDNPYTGAVSSTIDNCTLYNNTAPVAFNQPVGTAVSNVRFTNVIVWKSGAAYPGPLDGGPTIYFSYCDLDLVTPLSGNANLDADPLFVNAAGNDFHLTPCSPVIDKGYPVFGLTTDYEGNTRPQGTALDLGAYESAGGGGAAAAPTATSPSYCQNATATALTATGSNLLWYTVATNGTGSSTAPVPSTASVGTTTWYVTQTPAGSCESTRTPVTVTINSASAAPTATSPSYCQNATATALTATGSNLLWYTVATNGTGTSTAPVPSTTATGTTTWYVTQTPAGSCESARTPVTVTVGSAAAAPTAASPTYCQNATATALTATGSNLLWYTVATNGTSSSTAPVPSTTSAGTTTWYVTQTPAGSCESARTPVTVTVGSAAAAPTAASPVYCQNATATALTATGSNLLWYTVATNGTSSSTAPLPSTTSAGTTTWYVTQTPAGSCESARTPITVTINSQPAAPTATSPTYCQNDAAVVLTATGTNLLWYTAAAGGTGAVAAPTPSTATAGTITYYVSQTSGCESSRTNITVTVNGLPQVSISPVNGPLCIGGSATLSATGASTYLWSPATGLSDAASSNPVASLKTDMVYTVTGTDNNGCIATAQISLKPSIACLGYNIPDAFTPNGDGHNDIFRVATADVPQSFHMMIFNRYGGKVFETSDVQAGWNGYMGSTPAMTGAYVYTIVIKTSTGTIIEKKGTVLVIR
jgi:gliding motility-associated-like protein